MGIDAQMFARIKGREKWLMEPDVVHEAYQLSSTIGEEHFFRSKDHHALSIVQDRVDGCPVFYQDGPDFVGDPDDQFVQVHLWSRYYGEDYARGDWLTIKTVAEWLEWKFPRCEVWYGGDSSGVVVELLDDARREELHQYFFRNGHQDYTRHPGWNFGNDAPPACEFCGGVPMINTGGGRGKTFWYCDGCGEKVITHDGTVYPIGKKDFFEATKELDQRDGGAECSQD